VTDEQEWVQPSGVWATAVGVARVRALETERENALFRDPLAKAFATAGGMWPSSPPLPDDAAARRRRLAVSFSIVIRTKFLDDLLQQASASGVRQVVLLGAGMDRRAAGLQGFGAAPGAGRRALRADHRRGGSA
jgi:methyltransferase (TIGR00027 family)